MNICDKQCIETMIVNLGETGLAESLSFRVYVCIIVWLEIFNVVNEAVFE